MTNDNDLYPFIGLTPKEIAFEKLYSDILYVLTPQDRQFISAYIDQLEEENRRIKSKYSKLVLKI